MLRDIRKFFSKLSEIWRLGFLLAKTEFKLRNEGSYLGMFWYLLNPLIMFLIFLFIFSKNIGSNILFYPFYLLLGLIMFNFFSKITMLSTNTLISNAEFIKSIKINYESLVIANIIEFIYSHILEFLVFGVFLFAYGFNPLYLLFYIPILLLFCVFILGLSFILVTIGVYVTDLGNVWLIASQILLFTTPIFYSANTPFFFFNPLYYFITIARDILIYNKMPSIWLIAGMVVFSVVFLIIGLFIFEKYKNKFAEFV